MIAPESIRASDRDRTLAALLRAHAVGVPRGFYRSLIAMMPLAAALAVLGAWRFAAIAASLGGFAIWAECQQWLQGTGPGRLPTPLVRAAAACGAILLASAVAFLALDAFFRLLGGAPTL